MQAQARSTSTYKATTSCSCTLIPPEIAIAVASQTDREL